MSRGNARPAAHQSVTWGGFSSALLDAFCRAWYHRINASVNSMMMDQKMEEWQPIETAPKDGTIIDLTWVENGKPQEIWPMQWAHIQCNGLFPGKVGMWTMPNGGATWNDDCEEGAPTHWRPYVKR